MYNKILLAADGSEHSVRAADHAIKIAACNPETTVDIIYAIDTEHARSDVLHHWNSVDRKDIRKQRLRAIEEKAAQAGVKCNTKILFGEPGAEIVKYACDNKMDLIVIGSRGLNSLQEFVLGSVSHKVAKRANCPVMIVK